MNDENEVCVHDWSVEYRSKVDCLWIVVTFVFVLLIKIGFITQLSFLCNQVKQQPCNEVIMSRNCWGSNKFLIQFTYCFFNSSEWCILGKLNCFNITILSTFVLITLQLLKMLVITTSSTYAGNSCLSLSVWKYCCILNLLKCRKVPLYFKLADKTNFSGNYLFFQAII